MAHREKLKLVHSGPSKKELWFYDYIVKNGTQSLTQMVKAYSDHAKTKHDWSGAKRVLKRLENNGKLSNISENIYTIRSK